MSPVSVTYERPHVHREVIVAGTADLDIFLSELFELNFAQFGDTIFITHRNRPTREIFRESATSFIVREFEFQTHSSGYPVYEPYYKYAPSATTIGTSGTSGSVTVTASANSDLTYFVSYEELDDA